MIRNQAVQELDVLVGRWSLRMADAFFLEDGGASVRGSATVEWLGDAFVVLRAEMDGNPTWDFVFGHSDAHQRYTALYHDERGVSRVFAMTFGDGQWTMIREDPDFHQRFVATVTRDRIEGPWAASEDEGRTWRKDFDLIFERDG